MVSTPSIAPKQIACKVVIAAPCGPIPDVTQSQLAKGTFVPKAPLLRHCIILHNCCIFDLPLIWLQCTLRKTRANRRAWNCRNNQTAHPSAQRKARPAGEACGARLWSTMKPSRSASDQITSLNPLWCRRRVAATRTRHPKAALERLRSARRRPRFAIITHHFSKLGAAAAQVE